MMSATDSALRTEFAFVLPRGYVDEYGRTHREGVMRLATARDEIAPQVDPRVRANPAYLTVLLLERTITHLGDLPSVVRQDATVARIDVDVALGRFADDERVRAAHRSQHLGRHPAAAVVGTGAGPACPGRGVGGPS